jgi:chromate reductase, NAD(P)H dehydrogenase (quinone)
MDASAHVGDDRGTEDWCLRRKAAILAARALKGPVAPLHTQRRPAQRNALSSVPPVNPPPQPGSWHEAGGHQHSQEHPMTDSYKVAVLVGSLRKDSFNRKLAAAVAKLAPAGFQFTTLRIDDLPLYNQDDDNKRSEQAQRLKREVEAADALLFVTPEYNRSIPGLLKNAIDHASRPYGKNSFAGKPGAVIGVSVGATGTSMAQQHLRNVLGYLDVPTLGQPEVFLQFKEGLIDDAGTISNDSTREFLQGFVDRYVSWVKTHQPSR